ncbi:MAG TPA: adenylyl-sulfate kinase [Flavisolibacter sp.]|nr:adenylyl-sulfate kinase [Flavisolibacter sp.]
MVIIQMTGLSGAGKSTLAHCLKEALSELKIAIEVIDADVYRQSVCRDLGFSAADRRENIRRLARIADQHRRAGTLAVIAAINPYADVRKEISQQFGAKTVWVKCGLPTLIQRDTKGLYRKALLPDNHPQKIRNLSGINDPYEATEQADLIIDTEKASINSSTKRLLDFVLAELKPANPFQNA